MVDEVRVLRSLIRTIVTIFPFGIIQLSHAFVLLAYIVLNR